MLFSESHKPLTVFRVEREVGPVWNIRMYVIGACSPVGRLSEAS